VSSVRASHSLSTCDSRRKAFEAFVTLGGSPPRRIGCWLAPKVVVSSGKFVRVVILPLRGKDRLSGKEESG
jgi:hypothetical protein